MTDAPRTDEELRAAVAEEPCATCGAKPGRLDVFRVGTRVVLGGHCPFCATPRTFNFTVEGTPPSPTAPRSLSVFSSPAPRLLRLLVEPAPPATVGALVDALDIVLDESMLEMASRGTFVYPRTILTSMQGGVRMHAHYTFDAACESPVPSITALRERRVRAFAAVLTESASVVAALTARYGPPLEIPGARGESYCSYGPWVLTNRSCLLGWFEETPDWLCTLVDEEARRGALRMLFERARSAPDLATISKIGLDLPREAGIARSARVDGRGVELVFTPSMPASAFEQELAERSTCAVRSAAAAEDWELRRLPRADELGPTTPLALGPWALVPRLADAPTSRMDGRDVYFLSALDAVSSLQIGRMPAPTLTPTAAIVSVLLASPPPNTIGDLCKAMEVPLEGVDVSALTSAPGRLALPNLLISYELTSTSPLVTIEELRQRRPLEWTATFRQDFSDVDALLIGRFGPSEEKGGCRAYGPWITRRGQALGAGTLSYRPLH